jgi:hypothetical protein
MYCYSLLVCSTPIYTKLDGSKVCGILLGGKMTLETAGQNCKDFGAVILQIQSEEEKEKMVSEKVT